MPNNRDWLMGKTIAERYTMFENVEAKIDNYKTAYGLTGGWIDEVKLICQTFQAAYTGVMQSRATGKQRDSWFTALLESGNPQEDAPAPPVFAAIVLPAGAKSGVYKRFREMMEFFKSNDAYTEADGDDLMITAPEGEETNLEEVAPVFAHSADANGNVVSKYTKGDFSGAEMQWREAGQTIWQHGDKSDQTEIVFRPAVSNPNVPVKLELRGIYLLKGKRVGQWSQTGNLTYG